MSPATVAITLILAVLATATAVYWGFVLGRLIRLARHTPLLEDGLGLPVVDDLVSVIVPAVTRRIRSARAAGGSSVAVVITIWPCGR